MPVRGEVLKCLESDRSSDHDTWGHEASPAVSQAEQYTNDRIRHEPLVGRVVAGDRTKTNGRQSDKHDIAQRNPGKEHDKFSNHYESRLSRLCRLGLFQNDWQLLGFSQRYVRWIRFNH